MLVGLVKCICPSQWFFSSIFLKMFGQLVKPLIGCWINWKPPTCQRNIIITDITFVFNHVLTSPKKVAVVRPLGLELTNRPTPFFHGINHCEPEIPASKLLRGAHRHEEKKNGKNTPSKLCYHPPAPPPKKKNNLHLGYPDLDLDLYKPLAAGDEGS